MLNSVESVEGAQYNWIPTYTGGTNRWIALDSDGSLRTAFNSDGSRFPPVAAAGRRQVAARVHHGDEHAAAVGFWIRVSQLRDARLVLRQRRGLHASSCMTDMPRRKAGAAD